MISLVCFAIAAGAFGLDILGLGTKLPLELVGFLFIALGLAVDKLGK